MFFNVIQLPLSPEASLGTFLDAVNRRDFNRATLFSIDKRLPERIERVKKLRPTFQYKNYNRIEISCERIDENRCRCLLMSDGREFRLSKKKWIWEFLVDGNEVFELETEEDRSFVFNILWDLNMREHEFPNEN